MRNLKRALSLALASVMLLGMMVVGTSAASYPDVKDSDNVEAIEVLNAVGVMVGDRGNFRPDSPVNRHEMAAIMARLILGEDAETYVGNHPFTDVYPWADKYVAACYESGIINGTSKTTFSGNQPLTAIQAATMMLRALGYEHLTKDATDWRVPVAAQANKIGLFRGVTSSPSAQLTRNQVAQLALNTLESDVVEFTGTLGFEVNGVTVGFQAKWDPKADPNASVYSGNAYNYTQDEAPARGEAGTHQYMYIQLCEELYDGQLLKDSTENDEFGRPAVKWIYKGQEVVAASKDTVVTFDSEKKEEDIFKALNVTGINGTYARYVVMDEIWENGVLKAEAEEIGTTGQFQATAGSQAGYKETVIIAKGDSSKAAGFGDGISVEIYPSDKANHYVMVIVKSTVAKVTNIVTAKDKTTYTMDNAVGSFIDYADEKDDDKIVLHGDVAKGDYVTCAVIDGVAHVWPTTKVTGTQTAKNSDNEITISGNKYPIGVNVNGVNVADYVNSTKEANYYIDRLGYVVKTDSTASTDYAYITDVYADKSSGIDGTDLKLQVRALLADGTVGVYDVEVEKKSGNWVLKDTTTVLGSVSDVNGGNYASVYSALGYTANTPASGTKAFGYTLDGNKISLEPLTALPANSTATANDTVYFASLGDVVQKNTTKYDVNTDKDVLADKDTVFVIYNADKKTATVYTGAANLPKSINDENGSTGGTGYAVLRTGTTSNVGTASVIFVNTATGVGAEATDDYVYINATKWTETKDGSSTKYVYKFTRPDGTEGETAAGDRIGTGVKSDSGVYVLKSDGTIDKTRPTKGQYVNSGYSNLLTVSSNNNLVGANGQWYNIDEAQIVYIDDSIGTLDGNDGYVVLKLDSEGTPTSNVETIFVVKAGDGADAPVMRTVADFTANTDSATTGVTLAATKSAASVTNGSTVSYEFSLGATASKTCRYTITLAGLSGVAVTPASAPNAPANWEIVKVSDTQLTVNVKNTSGIAGKITVSGTATGNVTATSATSGVELFAMNNKAEAVVDSAALKVKVEADKALAASGETVTYTVTVSGTTAAGWTNEKIKIAGLTGLTGASALAVAKDANNTDIPHPNCAVSGLDITISAASTTTSGTFTVSGTASAAVTPTVTYEA